MPDRSWLLTGALLLGSSCAATPDATNADDTSDELQPLSCNVGAPGALADACGKAANPVSITSPAAVTNDSVAYGVHLVPGDGGNVAVLDFEPLLSGTYDIYLGTPHIPAQLFASGLSVPETPTCDSTIASTECSSLRRVLTFQLVGRTEYSLQLGTTDLSYVRLYIQLRRDTPPMCGVGELTQETAACTATAAGDVRFAAVPRGSTQTAPIALDTVYGVHLTFEEASVYGGAFDFTPPSDGDYELYLGTANIPLMLTGAGAVVVGDCTRTIMAGECSQLRRGTRLTLRAGVSYRFELGPTGAQYVRVEMRRSASSPLDIKLGPGEQVYTGPVSLIGAADLDADGALDLVTQDITDSTGPVQLFVLRNTGGPSFTEVGPRYSAYGTTDIAFADMTGDGLLDIAAIDNDLGPIPPVFLASTGNLMYTQSTFGAGYGLGEHIDRADFDEDGIADLIATYDNDTGYQAGFVIFGMPGFAVLQDEPSDFLLTDAVTGDFDGDGHQDVVTVSQSSGQIRLYRGDGSGHVTRALDTAVAAGAIRAARAVDLDGDGKTDLVLLHSRAITVAMGTSTGFSTPQTLSFPDNLLGGLAVGDFNHDGRLDIVTNGSTGDFNNDFRAIFLIATDSGFVATSRMPDIIAGLAGDFDGDGFDDLVRATGSGILLYRSTP